MDDVDIKLLEDLDKNILCRLCMSVHFTDNVAVFENTENTPLYQQIQACTGIQLSREDGLPSIVCRLCAQKVTEWYIFILSVRKTDDYLRQIMKNKDNDIKIPVTDLTSKCENDWTSDSDKDEDVPLCELLPKKEIQSFAKPRKSRWGRRRSPTLESTTCRQHPKKVKPYCSACDLKFLEFAELLDHDQSVHGLSAGSAREPVGADSQQFIVHRCHICSSDFSDRKSLRMHCREKHDVKVIHPYGCTRCQRQFPSWSLLVVHERQHTGDKPYSCDVCGKENFISLASLRRHKLMHDKVFSCNDCGKHFNCASALRAHIRCKHMKEKPFLCTICGRSFSLVTILNAHMTSHSSERKYKCDICGFRSKTSGNHHRHRARHDKSASKTFRCEICGKAFESKLKLGSHSIIHTSDRPHSCSLCGKGFIYKNKMERHVLQVHAKERRFPCHICGRKLASKFGLGIHLKTHSKFEPLDVTLKGDIKKISLETDHNHSILTIEDNNTKQIVVDDSENGLLP